MRVREIFAIASLSVSINSTWANTNVSIKDSDLHKFDMIFSGGTKIPTFDVDPDEVLVAESRVEATPIINDQELKVHKDPTKIDTTELVIPVFRETVVPTLTLSDDFTTDSTDTNKSTLDAEEVTSTDEVTQPTTAETNETNDTHIEVVDEQVISSDETDNQSVDVNVSEVSNSVFENPTDVNLEILDEPTFDVSDVVPTRTPEDIPPLELVSNDWDTVTDMGYGWNSVDWFGSYFKPSDETHINQGSWVFHVGLGWLFVSSESFDSVWMWSETLGGWIWTNETTFGYIYLNESATWMWFDSERNLIYDFVLEKYIDISDGVE